MHQPDLRALSISTAAIGLHTRAEFVEEGRPVGGVRLPDGFVADDVRFHTDLSQGAAQQVP